MKTLRKILIVLTTLIASIWVTPAIAFDVPPAACQGLADIAYNAATANAAGASQDKYMKLLRDSLEGYPEDAVNIISGIIVRAFKANGKPNDIAEGVFNDCLVGKLNSKGV